MSELKKVEVRAFKAFNEDWTCRDFKYEVGKTYTHEGEIQVCVAGFHACKAPLDVWNYYPPENGRKYAEVVISGRVESRGDKIVGSSIAIIKELSVAEMIDLACGFISDAATAATNGGESASGYASAAASSGNASTAASSGNYSKAASSGHSSIAASSGYASTAASSGNYSKAASSGYSSIAASSGRYSKAVSSGKYSTAAALGEDTIAMVAGSHGRAMAGDNGCFALSYYCERSKRNRIVIGYVGEDGVKPDTWYRVDDGKLVECEGSDE